MVPRITVRDQADVALLLEALNLHMHLRITELNMDSRKGGADQYALSMTMIAETENVCELVKAIAGEYDQPTESDGPSE